MPHIVFARTFLGIVEVSLLLRSAINGRAGVNRPLFYYIELSNNCAEHSIRTFVVRRKSRLFAKTPTGAQPSTVIYSLIEATKENDLDPYRHLI